MGNCNLKRQRSHLFKLANEGIKRIRDLNCLVRSDFDSIVSIFENWFSGYQLGKYVRLRNENDYNDYLFIRAVNRFQPIYKRKIYNNFAYLRQVKFKHHFVLEVNPHLHMLYYTQWNYMLRGWARLRAWIYKTYGKFEFLRIVELHKSKRPHFHILISGIEWIDYKKIEDFWKTDGKYNIGFTKRKEVDENFDAVDYLLKYIKKTISSDKTVDIYNSAVFFAMNKRLFSISRGLLSTFSLKIYRFGFWKYWKQKYEWCGSVGANLINAYAETYKIEKDSMMYRIYCTDKDLYSDYSNIFSIDYDG